MNAVTTSKNLYTASQQWANRPNDQRFLSLADLHAHVAQRKAESWTATPSTKSLGVDVIPTAEGQELIIDVYDPTAGSRRQLIPTHHAFNQLSQYAGAPAAYLRKLAPELACANLEYGLKFNPVWDDSLILAQSNGHNQLRAMTSASYGRIWDLDVVKAVESVNQDGRWQIPAASYATTNPKRATTLYASDRDVFIFLVDPNNPVEVNGENLFRGFMTWNSEVGDATFGLTSFLYRYVCDNRIIWGATEVNELKIRHTGGAPQRFAYEGAKFLKKYAEESTVKLVEGVKRAQAAEIPLSKDQSVAQWLQKRGFTKSQAQGAVDSATAEEGGVRSVWDIVNGITAYARTVPHTNDRVALETNAGKLMAQVAA